MGLGIEARLQAIQADPATTFEDYTLVRSALMRLLDPAAMGRFQVMAFGRAWPAMDDGGARSGCSPTASRPARIVAAEPPRLTFVIGNMPYCGTAPCIVTLDPVALRPHRRGAGCDPARALGAVRPRAGVSSALTHSSGADDQPVRRPPRVDPAAHRRRPSATPVRTCPLLECAWREWHSCRPLPAASTDPLIRSSRNGTRVAPRELA